VPQEECPYLVFAPVHAARERRDIEPELVHPGSQGRKVGCSVGTGGAKLGQAALPAG